MSLQDSTATESMIEECLDEMNNFVSTLDRYPPTTIAVTQSVHLQTLLCALVDCGLSTPEEVRNFVEEFAQDVLTEIGVGRSGSSKAEIIP